MASLCTRCALRLQPTLDRRQIPVVTQAFSTATSRARQHEVPTFAETSNAELNDILASMRDKHFIPAALPRRERRMIFGTKYRKFLEEDPQSYRIGDQDYELRWLDRRTEIPNRNKLLNQALKLMSEGDLEAWKNLPALLAGLNAVNAIPEKVNLEKIVRLAGEAGNIDIIMKCVDQSEQTGVTLEQYGVLHGLLWGLRDKARRSEWSEEVLRQVLKSAQRVATHLETERHGGQKTVRKNDPRTRPEVLGVFLELAAVKAQQHQEGKDTDGSVRAYAERLLSNIDPTIKPNSQPAPRGPQVDMQQAISIWHGLFLAQQILGNSLPRPEVAKRVLKIHEQSLTELAKALESKNPQEGTYDATALAAWRDCRRS